LVESDPDLAAALQAALVADGHSVQHAPTALEALAMGDPGWEACVADVAGPQTRTFGSLHRAWVRELSARSPVVLIAAQAWIETLDPSAVGVVAALRKPFSIRMLRRALAAVR
jgi:DNA-binding response OmpR family regulator